jgi:hypothetical protein
MRTHSRDQGRTAGVGSVKRSSPGFGPMGETRRNRPFVGRAEPTGSLGQRSFAGATVIVPIENLWWPVSITV